MTGSTIGTVLSDVILLNGSLRYIIKRIPAPFCFNSLKQWAVKDTDQVYSVEISQGYIGLSIVILLPTLKLLGNNITVNCTYQ